MRRKSASLWLGATLLALAIVIAAVGIGSDVGYALTVPGLLLAWPVWPEGVHTRPGAASAMAFYLVYLFGNFLVWSLTLRMVLGLVFRRQKNAPTLPERDPSDELVRRAR